jgi:hypothetical protein
MKHRPSYSRIAAAWLLTSVICAVSLASAPVSAGPQPGPVDLLYPERPVKQKRAIERKVRRLVWPTLISPALVRWGGRFDLLVKVAKGPDGKPILPVVAPSGVSVRASSKVKAGGLDPSWKVYLLAKGAAPKRCPLVAWTREGTEHLRLTVQARRALARDVYSLRIVAPGIDDSQPNAVRVHGASEPERFRFVVMTDHQLWDPSFALKGRALHSKSFPAQAGAKKLNEAITRQGFDEIKLLDPAFVLHTGDLIFGLDFTAEYQQARRELVRARLPVFAIPGNHDGYAIYTVRLKGGAVQTLTGAIGCKKHLDGDLSWGKLWVFVACVYGDVKEHLYADLQADGLAFWRRQLGPDEYAFDYGRFRFIAVNTYSGTPERRHAFSIYMDILDLHLGAPAVDNYGGYLTDPQLVRIERELKQTRARGLVPVVFGHHDPRGNAKGDRYHPNEPFPTDPLGMNHFEEWNYDGKWDSDPKDKRSKETAGANSASRFLAALARYGGYYISGHVHADGRKVYPMGSWLGSYRVERRLELIRTTSAASSVKKGAYWGYRLLEAEGEQLRVVDFSKQHKLSSIPAGNFWVRRLAGKQEREVATSLPRALTIRVPWELKTQPLGYRFRLGAAPDSADPLATPTQPEVSQIERRGDKTRYWLRLKLPASSWPPSPKTVRRMRLRAVLARDNSPPQPVIDMAVAGGLALQQVDERFDAAPGQPVLLSAERTKDAQDDRILSYRWDFGAGHSARGKRVVHVFAGAGTHTVRLTLVDETGAQVTVSRQLRVQAPVPKAGCRGCCAPAGEGKTGLALLWLGVFGLVALRRRRLYDRDEGR